MKKSKVQITRRDFHILNMIWRWKLGVTSSLAGVGYLTELTCYQRMLRLKNAGYVRRQHLRDAQSSVWTLEKKGFLQIVDQLPKLVAKAHKLKDPNHDLLAYAVSTGCQGYWATRVEATYTEQEINRIDKSCYPDWVPNLGGRVPDGLLLVEHGQQKKVVAIEIELSIKSKEQYEAIGYYYSYRKEIDTVIWVVPTSYLAEKVYRQIKRKHSDGGPAHLIVTRRDFESLGWGAPKVAGNSTYETIADLLAKFPEDAPKTLMGQQYLNPIISYRKMDSWEYAKD